MSIFRFAGNISEGMRESDERARGRRAKAIEAYDAFVRNNPEATKQELFGRREMLGDGSNYLLSSLPTDQSIAARAARNEEIREANQQEREAKQLERQVRQDEVVQTQVKEAVRSALAGNRDPSTIDQSAIISSVRKSLEGRPNLVDSFARQFGSIDQPRIVSSIANPDGSVRQETALSGLIFGERLALLEQGKKVFEAFGGVMTPDQIEKNASIPPSIKPYVKAVAAERLAQQSYERSLKAASEGRAEAATALAERKQSFLEESTEIQREIASEQQSYDRAQAEINRVEQNLERFRNYELKLRQQDQSEMRDKRDFDFSKEKHEEAKRQYEEKQQQVKAIQARQEELERQKAALAAEQEEQEALANSAKANLSSMVASADLSEAEAAHVTNNLLAVAERYHIPSTQQKALVDIAVAGEDDMGVNELVNTFIASNGQLRTRKSMIQSAARGIMRAPERMDAKIDATTKRIFAPAGGFTDDVMNKTLHIKKEMNRFAAQVNNGTVPPARAEGAKRHFANLIERVKSQINSAGASTTYGYNQSVINQLKIDLDDAENIYINNIVPLKGTAPPPATTPTASQTQQSPQQQRAVEDRKLADAVLDYQMAATSNVPGYQLTQLNLDKFVEKQFPNATGAQRANLLGRAKQMLTGGEGFNQASAGRRGSLFGTFRPRPYSPVEEPD